MTRIRLVPATAALIASFCLFGGTTIPISAQEMQDGLSQSELRDFIQDAIMARGERRQALRENLSDSDYDGEGSMGMLRERLGERRARRAEIMEFLSEHPFLRERLRERLGERLRERIGERFARAGGDEERCFFLTRILRSEDRDFLVLIRRRVCRD